MSDLTKLSTGSIVPQINWRKQDWAYEQLHEWIITGELPPGGRIEQEQLARVLGISRIPLREALARLSAEGLLRGRAHQQLVVSELTLEDARDVYCGRMALESALAARATDNARPSDLARLQEILDLQSGLLESGTPDEFRALDHDFHLAIYGLAAAPKTLNAASSLFAMSQRYVRLYLSERDRSANSFDQHTAIFEAIRSGDRDLAARLTGEHVATGLASLEATLAES